MISAGRAASRREGERDGVGGGDVVALLIEDDPHQVEQRRGPVDHQDMLAAHLGRLGGGVARAGGVRCHADGSCGGAARRVRGPARAGSRRCVLAQYDTARKAA